MSAVLIAVGLGLLATPAVTFPLSRRVMALFWQRLVATALIGGTLTIELGVLLWGLPTLFSTLGMTSFARICARIAGHLFPGSRPAGWMALTVALVIPLMAARAWRKFESDARVLRARIEEIQTESPGEPVVMRDPEPRAFVVAGAPSYVVVSSGLLDQLPPIEVKAVLAHEAAHVSLRHHRTLRTAVAVEAVFGRIPLVKRSLGVLRLAAERAADEMAGTSDEVRGALGSALLRMVGVGAGSDPLAITGAETVVARLDYLAGKRVERSVWREMLPAAPVSVLSGLAVGVLYVWLGDVHLSLTMAGICWT